MGAVIGCIVLGVMVAIAAEAMESILDVIDGILEKGVHFDTPYK